MIIVILILLLIVESINLYVNLTIFLRSNQMKQVRSVNSFGGQRCQFCKEEKNTRKSRDGYWACPECFVKQGLPAA